MIHKAFALLESRSGRAELGSRRGQSSFGKGIWRSGSIRCRGGSFGRHGSSDPLCESRKHGACKVKSNAARQKQLSEVIT